jgi:putative transposase
MATRSLISGETYFTAIKQKTFGTGFYDDACKEFYLRRLQNCQNAFQVQLHAYLLMEQVLFLTFTPMTPSGFYSFVRFLNDSYSRYYMIRFARNITAWQNEPHVCRLPSDKLVLNCQKFIERYVLDYSSEGHPGEHGFSSYSANAFTHRPDFLKRHRAVRKFLNIDANGLHRYRDFIAAPFSEEHRRHLQSRLLLGQPLLQKKPSVKLEIGGL